MNGSYASSPRKPSVMLLIRNLSGGGAELVVANLFAGLDRERFDVCVCELSGRGERAEALSESGFQNVVSLDPEGRRLSIVGRLRKLRRLRRLMIDRRVCVVHTHSTDALADAAIIKLSRPSIRLIHTFHFGNYPNTSAMVLRLERMFHRFADQLVAVGHAQAEAIARTYAIQATAMEVIWNGIQLRAPQIDHARFGAYLHSGKVLIGTIGTLIPQKGHADLIVVAKEIKRRRLPAMFLVVGSGPLQDELESEVRRAGVEDTVIFVGWVRDAATTILPALDVFYQPSRWEAMSMVLLEAAAAGKAIVCTAVGEADRIIENGRTGIVVQPGDHAAMVDALERLVLDEKLRARLGRAAQRDVASRCSADQMVAAYTALYSRILRHEQRGEAPA